MFRTAPESSRPGRFWHSPYLSWLESLSPLSFSSLSKSSVLPVIRLPHILAL